jgi:hypothetical protein
MEKPLIVRAMLAKDFPAAFMMVWEASGSPAEFDPSDAAKLTGRAPDRMLFALPREICLGQAAAAGKSDVADAWQLLAASPEGPRWRSPAAHRTWSRVLIALGRAIGADPTLLAADSFCEAVVGWKFLEQAGSDGEEDLIACAKSHGAALRVDRERLLDWAKRLAEEWR